MFREKPDPVRATIRAAFDRALKEASEKPATRPPRHLVIGVPLAAAAFVAGLYLTTPAWHPPRGAPIDIQPPRPPAPPPISIVPFMPPPVLRATPPIYLAVRNALVAAGVDEDKVDAPAADLSASIERAIATKTDELWWYGKIAVGSLVPLWIISLVALFRHKKSPVDLWSLRALVLDADRLAREREAR